VLDAYSCRFQSRRRGRGGGLADAVVTPRHAQRDRAGQQARAARVVTGPFGRRTRHQLPEDSHHGRRGAAPLLPMPSRRGQGAPSAHDGAARTQLLITVMPESKTGTRRQRRRPTPAAGARPRWLGWFAWHLLFVRFRRAWKGKGPRGAVHTTSLAVMGHPGRCARASRQRKLRRSVVRSGPCGSAPQPRPALCAVPCPLT
jgi:hypothetical protein